ncbi:MAG TPA: acyl-CoA dehydrogenase [Acidimicrobiales bacterium]|nr:acyl-CoA dehydrogenase [Acidimicrobiales bacterium]
MSIAITEDHQALAETVHDFLEKKGSRAACRALVDGAEETLPELWPEIANLGWLGLHIPEKFGGSGYGLEELVVVAEEFGRGLVPGPFIPTVIASAVINAAAQPAQKKQYLPGLADGTLKGAVALGGNVKVKDGKATGDAGVVLGARFADVLVVKSNTSILIVDAHDPGVKIETPANIDPSRTASKVTLTNAAATTVLRGAQKLIDLARLIVAAEAVGICRETTNMAAEYAKVRVQFGRVIATYQGVKHHCANMAVATELSTAAVWDAAIQQSQGDGADDFSLAAAVAASLALPSADLCVNLNQQVHGGIGFTWEHDAHLYMRRATALEAIVDANDAKQTVVDLTRNGVKLNRKIDLGKKGEEIRAEVQAFVEKALKLSGDEQRDFLVDNGYAQPHWPKPYGRNAGPVEQLVIDEEFRKAGIRKPQYGITAWNILTIIQHGNEDQKRRWVEDALKQKYIWCQLFSEPDAGSDAAGVKTKATKVDGGWLVNGQKVWTSGAHVSSYGFATVRTNPDVPKHDGITMMVIDMHAEGVEVRPLKQPTGSSDFNEVFFNDVFVSDEDVVGPVDGGWTVARATLGNESVSIGSGGGGGGMGGDALLPAFDADPDRLPGGVERIGRYLSTNEALAALNMRSVNRAVLESGPGPEGAITKLVLSEQGHDAADMLRELAGENAAFTEGEGMIASMLVLLHRAMSIAGGTSEIKRNQIGERILGLPRDPLIN